MFKIKDLEIENALLLAPMEDVTDQAFRLICRELGADVVYTEFVNCEGLVRKNKRTHDKLKLSPFERPASIQIYGGNLESMVVAAQIAEEEKPEFIDINAGCWVKKVVGRGEGAGLLKDPEYLQQLVGEIVKAVKLPVTVKTRLGWDQNSIQIIEVAKRLEDVGISALTVHCRTRSQGNKGDVDWSWIPKIKEAVKIPIHLNGGVQTAEDVKRAFDETGADAVMIATGAIGNPYIFKEAKELLTTGKVSTLVDARAKIEICLKHLAKSIEMKGEERALIEHRKFYTGYLKGLFKGSLVRNIMMTLKSRTQIEDILLNYLKELENHNETRIIEK